MCYLEQVSNDEDSNSARNSSIILKGNKCCTLTACPKKPFPRTSPCMRSEGLKMRWVRSPESMRRDSDRTMSLFWDISDSAPEDSGHLSILQLRLTNTSKLADGNCGWSFEENTVCTYIICLDRAAMLLLHCLGKGLILIGSFSCPEFGSSSRLGSLWVEPSFSGPSVELLPWRGWVEPGRSSGDCGLCSMVSCSGLVVSWITQFTWRKGYGVIIVLLELDLLVLPSYHMSPTSSAAMFLTGIPLTSSIWSPTCTERSVSLLRTAESNLWDNLKFGFHQRKTVRCVGHSETHPVTLTRRPVSWLRSVATVRPRRPSALGVKDTSATMCGLLVGGESDREEDTTPWHRQLPLQKGD